MTETASGRSTFRATDNRVRPRAVAKYQRRFPGFDDKIISMYARGMSTREITGICAICTASTYHPT